MDYKDILTRAVKTFAQAFLAYLSVQVVTIKDWGTAKPVIVAAAAAGISAVWNLFQSVYNLKRS